MSEVVAGTNSFVETPEQILARVKGNMNNSSAGGVSDNLPPMLGQEKTEVYGGTPEKPKTVPMRDQIAEIVFHGTQCLSFDHAKMLADQILDKVYL